MLGGENFTNCVMINPRIACRNQITARNMTNSRGNSPSAANCENPILIKRIQAPIRIPYFATFPGAHPAGRHIENFPRAPHRACAGRLGEPPAIWVFYPPVSRCQIAEAVVFAWVGAAANPGCRLCGVRFGAPGSAARSLFVRWVHLSRQRAVKLTRGVENSADFDRLHDCH